MNKLPLLSSLELCKILKRLGFEEIRQRGSHRYFRHPDGRVTVVPIHSGRKIGRGLLRRILREIEIDREEFLSI